MTHGTYSSYVMGCRCDDCRHANRLQSRKYRKQRDRNTPVVRRQPRFDAQPVLMICARRLNTTTDQLNAYAISQICGVSELVARTWLKGEGVLDRYADRVAIRLGLHPSHLWGNDWWASAELDFAETTHTGDTE